MEIQGRTSKRLCVVIPIDNDEGTVVDSYEGKIDGLPTMKPLSDVQLNLTAFEFRDKKFGQTHGLKASFSKQRLERMTQEELKTMPFLGNMKPWNNANSSAVDDLPPGNEEDEW